MQSLKSFKFKNITKKCKDFLAITLISSSILVSCNPKQDDSIYGKGSDFDFNSVTDNDVVNDKDVLNDTEVTDKETTDMETIDNELTDNELIDNEVSDMDVIDNELIDNELTDYDITDNEVIDDETTDTEIFDLDTIDIDVNDIEIIDNEVTDIETSDIDSIDVDVTDNEIADEDIFTDNAVIDEDILIEPDEETDNYVTPDEDIPTTNINTRDKYIVSSVEIEQEYQKDCFDYTVLAKLIGAHCQSADKIDLETVSGKCYVPYYMTGNAPIQATSSCYIKLLMDGVEGSIAQGLYETNPDAFHNKVILLNKYLVYSYLIHENVSDENIRNIVTYPHDNMDEQYLIPNYFNSFEYGGVPYSMLNEHLDVLHEMEFINGTSGNHTRYRLYPSQLKDLGNTSFFVLDLLKCPQEVNNEAAVAKLGFLSSKGIVENDPKYLKFINGECDAYYDEKTQELIDEIKGN